MAFAMSAELATEPVPQASGNMRLAGSDDLDGVLQLDLCRGVREIFSGPGARRRIPHRYFRLRYPTGRDRSGRRWSGARRWQWPRPAQPALVGHVYQPFAESVSDWLDGLNAMALRALAREAG